MGTTLGFLAVAALPVLCASKGAKANTRTADVEMKAIPILSNHFVIAFSVLDAKGLMQ
jgi:hypothetical protein